MWVDVAFKLISSNETLATFPIVFIVKIYNNLSEWFILRKWFERGPLVWNWILCCIMEMWGSGVSAKQTEVALIVWCTLMKSAIQASGMRSMHGFSFPTSSPKSSLKLSFPALVLRRRGLMSHTAKRMAGYLGISRTLVFQRHCVSWPGQIENKTEGAV